MKIICVGRNYAAHAAELNNPTPEQPVIFLKPDTALAKGTDDFYLPDFSQDVHHECEVVFRIGKQGKHIQPEFALSYLDGVGLGIDFTARDLQNHLKAKSLPWELAKAFNNSAPVSDMLPIDQFPDLRNINFELKVNGQTRQQGNTGLTLFSLQTLITFVSQYFTLKTGDLLFTGTPAGVAAVKPGDRLEGFLEGDKMLDIRVK
jgi:2-keto-4-pentenoate hydratase/2-oxohepta-3-ene-1,7-dioic acid hydratase in catechol pathway